MSVRCPRCGREYDVTLFEFNRSVDCDCGETVSFILKGKSAGIKDHSLENGSRVMNEFRKRQTRQIVAVAVAMFLVLLVAVVHKRPDLFGEFGPGTFFGVQAIVISSFIGFTAANWKCPSCGKHLGGDINRRTCGRCGSRLQ